MAKSETLSDSAIVTKVLAKSKEAVGWYDSRLSRERTRTLAYYNGELPARQHEGGASYISTDVYDAVEMLKSQLLEVFGGGEDIVRFDPDSTMSGPDCQIATAYAKWVIYRQNDGYSIFSNTIHDGLMARSGVAKVFWEEKADYREETFHQIQVHEAMGLAAQPDIDEFDADLDPVTGTYSGSLVRKINTSKVSIIVVPPEEFLISPRSVSIEAAPYVGHRTLKTKAELIDMGYDAKVVEGLHYDDSKGLDLSPEVLERNRPVETVQALNNPIQPELEQVMLYESYVRMQIDKSKGVRLYKICHVNDVLLDKQEVDKVPFFPYVPLPIPHMFYGNNFAARVIPFQNAQTILTRGVLDHTATTVNPRWAVVKGGLINPREMLENRLGGIVNVRTADSVLPLAMPSLNPFVFQVMGQLSQQKEQSTGISALSQGLNKDAISQQNSQGLVDQLVTLSSIRQKIAARNFAYNFLVPIYVEVIRLAILNEAPKTWIEVSGGTMQVDPATWTERKTCTVSAHLGYGEKDQTISQMTQGYAMMAQDPVLGQGFGYEQRHAFAQDIMEKHNWANRGKYLLPPDQVKPPEPDPMKVKEMQIKDKEADAAVTGANARVLHEQTHAVLQEDKQHTEKNKVLLSAMDHDRTQRRQDLETVSRVNIANREMDLAEKTAHREAFVTTP